MQNERRKMKDETNVARFVNDLRFATYALRFHGFTLLESMMVFAILGILSTMMFSTFHSKDQSAQLDFDTDTFLGNLYEARSLALAGQMVNGIRPNGGYGIQIASCATPPCQYIVFADSYPAASASPNYLYDSGPGQDQVVSIRSVSNQVLVSSVTPISPSTIVFTIPNGSVYINGAQAASEFVVEFRHVSTGSVRRVRVNQASGRMNFE